MTTNGITAKRISLECVLCRRNHQQNGFLDITVCYVNTPYCLAKPIINTVVGRIFTLPMQSVNSYCCKIGGYCMAEMKGVAILSQHKFVNITVSLNCLWICSWILWPAGCFTNVLRALQNVLSKFVYCRYLSSAENFKVKLCMCAQSMALGTHTKFQIKILNRSMIYNIVYFHKIILESSWNISETIPGVWI